MKKLLIIRIKNAGEEGLFGTGMGFPGDFTCHTGELAWVDANHDGKRDTSVSSIRPWKGIAKRVLSPKRGTLVYQLVDAPDASAVQIHSGNFCGLKSKGWDTDIEGCILLGSDQTKIKNSKGVMQEAVTGSKAAVLLFEQWAAGEDIEVTISEQFPGVPELNRS